MEITINWSFLKLFHTGKSNQKPLGQLEQIKINHYYHHIHLNDHFLGNLGQPVPPPSSFSICLGTEPVNTSGTGFLQARSLPVTQATTSKH